MIALCHIYQLIFQTNLSAYRNSFHLCWSDFYIAITPVDISRAFPKYGLLYSWIYIFSIANGNPVAAKALAISSLDSQHVVTLWHRRNVEGELAISVRYVSSLGLGNKYLRDASNILASNGLGGTNSKPTRLSIISQFGVTSQRTNLEQAGARGRKALSSGGYNLENMVTSQYRLIDRETFEHLLIVDEP